VDLILIIAIVGMGAAAVVAVALGKALRRSSSQDDDEARMARLGGIVSPTGTPFFADRKAALDLAEDIRDMELQP